MTVGITSLVQPFEVAWGRMAAAGTLTIIPIIIANRYIVAGLEYSDLGSYGGEIDTPT